MKIIIIVFLYSLCVSCSVRYYDSMENKIDLPIEYGSFNAFANHNVFNFQNTIIQTRDKEKYYPIHFSINLPKGIRYYSLGGMKNFIFNYDNKQNIYIYTDIYSQNKTEIDTVYTPSQMEVDSIIASQFHSISPKGRFSIENNRFNRKRKFVIAKKNTATIILYNIKSENLSLFMNCTNSFRFIENRIKSKENSL